MFGRIRVATATLLAGLVMAAALVTVAAPTPASAGVGQCDRGELCAYSGPGLTGILRLETAGNWSGRINGVRSVINRGWQCLPACDHIDLTYYDPIDQVWSTICLHYEYGGHIREFRNPVTITRAVWRREC